VYCLEEADNGSQLHRMILPREAELTARFEPDLLGGIEVIEGMVLRETSGAWNDDLYREEAQAGLGLSETRAKFIPYYAWANRGPGEMTVWVRGG
jgi:Uncharacterized protein conserved in bacteria